MTAILANPATSLYDLARRTGADATGAVDATSKITAALAAIDAAGGGTLLVDGRFLFSTISHTFTNRLALSFTPGSKLISSQDVHPGSGAKCVQILTATGADLILDRVNLDFAAATSMDTDAATRSPNAQQLTVGGTNSSHFAGTVQITNGLQLSNARSTGFYTQYCNRVDFDRIRVDHALAAGVVFSDSLNVSGDLVDTYDTGDDGCQIVADAGLPGGSLRFAISRVRGYKNYAATLDLTGAVYGTIDSVVGDTTYYSTLLVQYLTNLGLVNTTDCIIGNVVSANAGQYYGPGQYKTSVSSLPNGIAIQGAVQRVRVGRRIITNPAGAPVNIGNNASGYPQATLESVATQRRRPQTGEYLGPDLPSNSTSSPASGAMHWTKVQVDEVCTPSAIYCNVTSAATGGTATLHMAIAADGGNLAPNGPVLWEGDTSSDATTTGVKTATPNVTLAAGTYWLGTVWRGTATGSPTFTCSTGQLQGFPRSGSSGGTVNGWVTNSVTGNVPNPIVLTGGFTGSAVLAELGF
jgi:hypothetical protein